MLRKTSFRPLTRYRATVEYDGTDYFGFQRQVAAQATIQGELENALFKLVQTPVPIVGAGRTDAGVHARGQVIAFDLPMWKHDAGALTRALNVTLPRAIAVREVGLVSAEFHPRFHATRRGYRYSIFNTPTRSPLVERGAWQLSEPLNLAAMQSASQLLQGRHDFATFGTPPQGNNSVRDLFRAEWREEASWLFFEIEATAFLKRMVRSIVGSLRMVGNGMWSVSQFADAFQSCDRSRSGSSAPPQGLVLEFVRYDEADQTGEQSV